MENEKNEYMDNYNIQQEIIKLTMFKYDGKEPSKQELNKFYKFLIMEFENNNSKNNISNRINSICKAIENKYIKYLRISKL